MDVTTLTFCVNDEAVYLALKRRGFGVGKLNGYGGKNRLGEPILETAHRELRQETWKSEQHPETGIFARREDFLYRARLQFFFADQLKVLCHIFLLNNWEGEPSDDNEEMAPHRLVRFDQLPFEKMWPADHVILPRLFEGETFTGKVYFDKNGTAAQLYNFESKKILRLP